MTHAIGPVRRSTVLAVTIGAAGILAARRIRRVEVTGASMQPALEPGDRVLVVRAGRLRTGDIVAFPDPRLPQRTMVKRVAAAAGDGVVVLGDNPDASTDSRHFGPIRNESIVGRLVYRYGPEVRRGWIGLFSPASRR